MGAHESVKFLVPSSLQVIYKDGKPVLDDSHVIWQTQYFVISCMSVLKIKWEGIAFSVTLFDKKVCFESHTAISVNFYFFIFLSYVYP